MHYLTPAVGFVSKRGAVLCEARIMRGDAVAWRASALVASEHEAQGMAVTMLASMLLGAVGEHLREFKDLGTLAPYERVPARALELQ